MHVKKLTPLLYVDEIESCLDFWYQLGFENGGEVPQDDRIGFIILKRDDVELMYQTRASIEHDVPQLAATPQRGSFLYLHVDDIDAIEKLLPASAYVIPRRKTFYGADEIIVREPGGNVVAFSQFGS